MADQRRRGGRGRSGRGGRIPRRGEGQTTATFFDESFVSFPMDQHEPITVPSGLDSQAAAGLLGSLLDRERRQAISLAALVQLDGDELLSEVHVQVARHRDMLEQLSHDLGCESTPGVESGSAPEGMWETAAQQRAAQLGWHALHRLALATGDKRILRVSRSILKDKGRHGELIQDYVLRKTLRNLFAEPPLDEA